MVLKELLEVVERVKDRAERFRDELQRSEALTRYALIDPILRALGWDTEDPQKVRPEFSTDSGNPDYALLWDGKPHLMVEAKALAKNLDAAKDKGFQYCWKNKVSYYVVTDGNAWEVHDLREMGGKEILRVQLDQLGVGEAARELLALWRPAMPVVEPAPTSVIGTGRSVEQSRDSVPADRLIPLPELEDRMKKRDIPRNTPAPQRIVFPDGREQQLKHWKDLLIAVVAWRQERLGRHVPITWPRTGRLYVDKDGSRMRAPKPVGPYWVETHASAHYLVKAARHVLSVLGDDPGQIQVVLRQVSPRDC
ncbi:MAG: hypothetical protein Kow0097_04140 [Candidatus Bipolaricaulota bacterium]|nr:hypothetical protein [Candidatus Bipolaricaulota bacterium]